MPSFSIRTAASGAESGVSFGFDSWAASVWRSATWSDSGSDSESDSSGMPPYSYWRN